MTDCLRTIPISPSGSNFGIGFLRGGAATFGAQGIRFIVRLATQIAIARFLIPADYGLIAMVAPIFAFVQLVADLGLGQAIIQRTDLRQTDVSTLFWITIAVNMFVACILALLAPVVALIYSDNRLIPITIILAFLIPVSGLSTVPTALLSRNLRFIALAAVDGPTPIIGLVSGFIAAWLGLGYWALIISAAAESVTGTMIVWVVSPWRPDRPSFNASTLPAMKIGGDIIAFNLTLYVTTTFDNILLALTQGAGALGLYDKGYKTVTQSISQLISPINRMSVPVLVRLLPTPDQYNSVYLNIIRFMLLISWPLIIFLAVTAQSIVPIVFGPQWTGISPIISWLCVGCLASPLYSSTYWLFLSQGRSREQLTVGMVTSVIAMASFVAGLSWGPAGVAAGAGLSFFLISTPLTCWVATKKGPIPFQGLISAVLPFLVAGLTTAGVIVFISAFTSSRVALLGVVPLIYILFGLVLSTFADSRTMLILIYRLLKTRGGKSLVR